MIQGKRILTPRKPAQFCVMLTGCLAVLFSLLFPFQNAFEENSLGDHTSHTEVRAAHNSDHLPFPSGPIEPSPTEKESTDDSEDDLSKLFEHLFVEVSEELLSEKHIFIQLRTVNENRSRVSYFILYHCWKSFPAELA